MPYISERIKIAGTKYDRRRKLTDDQKDLIRWLREEEQISYNKLAKMFNVSKRTIQFVCCPDKMMKCRERFIKARRAGKYKPTKEQWAETIREHRRYKQDLRVQGKI